MFDAETRALLRTLLDQVCEQVDEYQTVTRAHVAAQILAAAGRETSFEEIREVGREALKTVPTMWR